ncbi:GPI inositol deacylase [Allomyces arbusculus]|nr:GPI inositol deacylase [Allomyces arbusculus]
MPHDDAERPFMTPPSNASLGDAAHADDDNDPTLKTDPPDNDDNDHELLQLPAGIAAAPLLATPPSMSRSSSFHDLDPAASSPRAARRVWARRLRTFALIVVFAAWFALAAHWFRDRSAWAVQRCTMSYMWPRYVEIPNGEIINAVGPPARVGFPVPPKYRLFLYREGTLDGDVLPGESLPVVFVPGNAGSYQQVRSLASRAAMLWAGEGPGAIVNRTDIKRFDFYTIDYHEELGALSGALIEAQAKYLDLVLRYLYHRYDRTRHVPLIAHSMGAVVARRARPFQPLGPIITLAAPHRAPPVPLDSYFNDLYTVLDTLTTKMPFNMLSPAVIAVTGGELDTNVAAAWTDLDAPPANVSWMSVPTTGMRATRTACDHQAILWCREVVTAIAEALYAAQPAMFAQQHYREKVVDIFREHLVDPDVPKTVEVDEHVQVGWRSPGELDATLDEKQWAVSVAVPDPWFVYQVDAKPAYPVRRSWDVFQVADDEYGRWIGSTDDVEFRWTFTLPPTSSTNTTLAFVPKPGSSASSPTTLHLSIRIAWRASASRLAVDLAPVLLGMTLASTFLIASLQLASTHPRQRHARYVARDLLGFPNFALLVAALLVIQVIPIRFWRSVAITSGVPRSIVDSVWWLARAHARSSPLLIAAWIATAASGVAATYLLSAACEILVGGTAAILLVTRRIRRWRVMLLVFGPFCGPLAIAAAPHVGLTPAFVAAALIAVLTILHAATAAARRRLRRSRMHDRVRWRGESPVRPASAGSSRTPAAAALVPHAVVLVLATCAPAIAVLHAWYRTGSTAAAEIVWRQTWTWWKVGVAVTWIAAALVWPPRSRPARPPAEPEGGVRWPPVSAVVAVGCAVVAAVAGDVHFAEVAQGGYAAVGAAVLLEKVVRAVVARTRQGAE